MERCVIIEEEKGLTVTKVGRQLYIYMAFEILDAHINKCTKIQIQVSRHTRAGPLVTIYLLPFCPSLAARSS